MHLAYARIQHFLPLWRWLDHPGEKLYCPLRTRSNKRISSSSSEPLSERINSFDWFFSGVSISLSRSSPILVTKHNTCRRSLEGRSRRTSFLASKLSSNRVVPG